MTFQFIPNAEASVVTLMNSVNRVIINPLIYLIFAIALVYFLYGVAKYFLTPENEEIRTSSKSHMFWGIFGMFIMIVVFGIMNVILKTLSVPDSQIKIGNDGYTIGTFK